MRHYTRLYVSPSMNLLDIEQMIHIMACAIFKRRSLYQRTFLACFGVTACVLAKCWRLINEAALVRRQEFSCRDLLWTSVFLKQYSPEDVLSATCGVSQKTFRLQVRKAMNAMNSRYSDVVSSHFLASSIFFFLNFNKNTNYI